MRFRITALSLLLAAGMWSSVLMSAEPAKPDAGAAVTEDGISLYFSPNGGGSEAIIAQLTSAKKTADINAYVLSSGRILAAIKAAHERGVKVRVVLDSDHIGEDYSGATYLNNAKIPTYIDAEHKEAHNKVMLIDGKTIITGSYNFTRAADVENAENLLIIQNKPKLFDAYKANFESHLKHSKEFKK